MAESWLEYADRMGGEQKSYREFLRGIHNRHTKRSYSVSMRLFMGFLHWKKLVSGADAYDEFASFDTRMATDAVKEWVLHNEEKGNRQVTVAAKINGIEKFIRMNEMSWHKESVRMGIRRDGGAGSGNSPVTNGEILAMLAGTNKLRTKALVHFLASTGIRPGALEDPVLRVRHLVDMPDPGAPETRPRWCYGVTIYEKSREEYWAFLTPEARGALDRYLGARRRNGEEITGESPLFASENGRGGEHLGSGGARNMMRNLSAAAGVQSAVMLDGNSRRYDKAPIYMFRKRFNTVIKLADVNYNIAEKLMGHMRGLDGVYLRPTIEESFSEFTAAIPKLTVDPAERHAFEIKEKQKRVDEMAARNSALESKNSELEEKSRMIDALVRRIEALERTSPEPAGVAAGPGGVTGGWRPSGRAETRARITPSTAGVSSPSP